jgi:sterol desaturase/sphingolipid hydroxylase (fatty acid hydroxylase superfamily)
LWPYRLATIGLHGPLGWVALFVAVEFLYYWHHRVSHGTRWLWATHGVHHTPEHMNVLAALRLGWTEEVSGGFLLFTPLVLVGFAPGAVAGMIVMDLLYQFWIHSESRLRLGWLGYVLNTPSHHRVHQGCNAAYLDRNFGGVLIVFDRLFGTFAAESPQDPPRYGLVRRMHSHNPATIVFHEWRHLISDTRAAATWRGRFAVLFGAP